MLKILEQFKATLWVKNGSGGTNYFPGLIDELTQMTANSEITAATWKRI